MAVRNTRKKLVNFRLSEEEWQALLKTFESSGARCVSEFVRMAVLNPEPSTSADDILFEQLTLIERKLAAAETKVAQIGAAPVTIGESVSLRSLAAAIC